MAGTTVAWSRRLFQSPLSMRMPSPIVPQDTSTGDQAQAETSAAADSHTSSQGTQYASFIEAELKRENERRTAVIARAASVMTGSAGLVTLVLALIAVIIGKDTAITGGAEACVAIAVLALLGSAACSLQASRARRSNELTSVETLRELIGQQHWKDTEVTARYQTAHITIEQIERLRKGSAIRGKWLRAAGIMQVMAVAALGLSTLIVALTQNN